MTENDYPIILEYRGRRNKVHLDTCRYADREDWYAPMFDSWEEVLEEYPNAKPCKICRPNLISKGSQNSGGKTQ